MRKALNALGYLVPLPFSFDRLAATACVIPAQALRNPVIILNNPLIIFSFKGIFFIKELKCIQNRDQIAFAKNQHEEAVCTRPYFAKTY